MKTSTKTLSLAALFAVAIAGIAEARGTLFAAPGPEKILGIASERLSLDVGQQAELLPLLNRAAKLRIAVKRDAGAMPEASRAELIRPDANLRALSAERELIIDTRLLEARTLRDDFITFYDHQLTPTQQAIAREQMLKRIDRFETLIERLQALRGEPMFGP